jgi:HlyD family secretion protein
MQKIVILLVVLLALGGVGYAAYSPVTQWWQTRNVPKWRLAEVEEGTIVAVRNSTGEVKPVLQISIGSFVSGPIDELYVEFNDEVKKGQLLAKIDPRIYEANAVRDLATLLIRLADVERVKAQHQRAINNENRAMSLQAEDPAFISQAQIDQVHFDRVGLEAEIQVAEASVAQASASLDNSLLNLEYTEIVSPVDGVVIDRKIDPGQTLAAQFQTPELFIVAPDLRKKMHVHASVDEADIGLIKRAQATKLPVSFTVDAYPDELFTGEIEEIRLSSTTTQNVVTYPVIVAAPNPDLKLLPGMTASLSFEVDRRPQVTKIPNAALRYFPESHLVREEDKPLLEGKVEEQAPADSSEVQEIGLSAEERAEARRSRNTRHVWVVDGLKLRAVEILTGLADSRFTELVSGDLKIGDKLVTGIEPPKAWGS